MAEMITPPMTELLGDLSQRPSTEQFAILQQEVDILKRRVADLEARLLKENDL